MKVAPVAHPGYCKPEINSSLITNENDKTKSTIGARNSDLVDIDRSSYSSPQNEGVQNIRSRYNKSSCKNTLDRSYRPASSYKTPKVASSTKTKALRNKSRILNSSTPKLYTAAEKKPIRNSSTKKKAKVPAMNVKNPSSTMYVNSYGNKQLRNSPSKTKTAVPATPVGGRVPSPRKTKAVVGRTPKVVSPKKKPVTPVRPPTTMLEKKFESHLPTTLKGHQPTRRKSPRKSPKEIKRPEVKMAVKEKSPIRSQVEYVQSSPKRMGTTPIMSPKRKSPRRDDGRLSPTKRMIQMKNSYIKNQLKAQKDPANFGKLIYTISPDEAYIVDQEFHGNMETDDIAKKSSELCYSADKKRSHLYGDSMMKYHHKRRVYGEDN